MDNKTVEKVSITVAAKALGVSVKTIQRWVNSGKIQSIREDNRVFIPVDEIRARLQDKRASIEDIDQDKKEDVQTSVRHFEDKSIDVIPIDRTHYENLLVRLGQLEANQQLLLEYRAGIESRDKALEQAKENISAQAQELATVKSALNTNSAELDKAKATITKARNELQILMEIKQDAEQKAKVVLDQQAIIGAREYELAEIRAKVERLQRSWWRRWFRRK